MLDRLLSSPLIHTMLPTEPQATECMPGSVRLLHGKKGSDCLQPEPHPLNRIHLQDHGLSYWS